MAMATGNLTIITDAMVHELQLDEHGKASGVAYIDRLTRTEKTASGRTVVLAASAGETARILLNSKSALFPEGAANSSGQVGCNLMDTVGAAMGAQFPVLEDRPAYNEDGAMGIKRIKERGGRTMVQSPGDAHRPVMPEAAIALQCVDHVLPLDGIGSFLADLQSGPAWRGV